MNKDVVNTDKRDAKLRRELTRIQSLLKRNQFNKARSLCERVNAQGTHKAEFLHLYGHTLRACGNFDDALLKIYAAHEECPTDANILNSLGLVFLDMNDTEAAITMFKRATSVDQRLYNAWVNLGTALRSVGRHNAAELAFTCAHHLDRSKPEPYLNIALIQVDLHRYERAATLLDDLLEKHKQTVPGIELLRLQVAMELEDLPYVKKQLDQINRASLNSEEKVVFDGVKAQHHVICDQFDEAISILEKIVAMKGVHYTDHVSHLGFCYGLAGRIDEGIATLNSLLGEYPDHATARHNLALLQFRKGELGDGFRNYEARWQLKEFSGKRRICNAPTWQGEPINGKRILVWREQGIGDEVRYASLLPDLNERQGLVTFECTKKLLPLWEQSFPWANIQPAGSELGNDDSECMEFDYQIPIGSLGSIFRKSIGDFDKKQKPWIARNHETEILIRNQLAIQPHELLIGICWRSTLQIASRDKVFLNCEQLQALKDLPNARWLNVQYSSNDEEVEIIRKSGLDLHHYVDLDQMNDLVGACNLLGACDVVISVGGSVGDLAGGVGTPLIYMTRELSEAFLGTDHVPWFVNCKSYPIKAYQADDTLLRIVNDWSSLAQWAESQKTEDRKANDLLAKGSTRPQLNLEYPIVERVYQ